MTHSSRIRAIGALMAVSALTGCSLIGGKATAPAGEPEGRAHEYQQAIQDTGRPPANGVLATMGAAPKELFTLPVSGLDPQEECHEQGCVVTWRPLDADTAVAEGAVGSTSHEDGHDFRTAVDLTTGESLWSRSTEVPRGKAHSGEICVGGSAGALVCVETASDRYAVRTISAKNGKEIAHAPFAEAPKPKASTVVGMSTERRGDVLHLSVLVQEDAAATRSSSVHAAKIAADGSIEWQNQSPASIGDGTLSETYLLGDQLGVTHVTTESGEPFAMSAQTGERVRMSSGNADALTGITESARQFVDDGSADDYRFRLDNDFATTHVLPAGDVDAEPLWSIPSNLSLTTVCGGVVALTSDPYADASQHAASVRALDDGSELWDLPLTDTAAISCDGERLVVVDDEGLTALDPKTGDEVWSVDGPWEGARAITALNPSGPSERFAVIGADAAGEETVTVFQTR